MHGPEPKRLLKGDNPSQNNTLLRRGMGMLLYLLQGILKVVLYSIINAALIALFAVTIVVKLWSMLPIPLLGMRMGPIPGLGSWFLDKLRFLAHMLLIPSSYFKYDKAYNRAFSFKSEKTTQYHSEEMDIAKDLRIAFRYDSDEDLDSSDIEEYDDPTDEDITKLIFALGGNGDSVVMTEQIRFKGEHIPEGENSRAYILPHFARDKIEASYTADALVDSYVAELACYIKDTNSVKLVGRSMGGAVLMLALEKMLSDHRFKDIEFEICVDRTFADLWQVTRSTGKLGFLYLAGPLLSLLGWNISPHKAMQNIIAKHSNRDIKIYINTAESDDVLGAGVLRGDKYFSNGAVKVFSKTFVGGENPHNDKDESIRLFADAPIVTSDAKSGYFREVDYFEGHYNSCHKYFINSIGFIPVKLNGKVTGITDKIGYAKRPVIRAKFQLALSQILAHDKSNEKQLSHQITELENLLQAAQQAYSKDRVLEDAKDFFYPIDKILFGLGFVFLASFNVFLVPACILIFAAMFFISNTYQNGLYSKLNIGFGIIAVGLGVLTMLGAAALAGALVVSSFYITLPAVVCALALCLTAVARGYFRSIEAKTNVSKALDMNIDLCVALEGKLAVESDPRKKAYYKRQLEVAKHSFNMLSDEQENLVRTIKNPFDKYFVQIQNVKNRVEKIKNMPWPEDSKVKAELLATTETTCDTMQRVWVRDIPWLIINIGMIVIASLAMVAPISALLLPTAIVLLPITPQLMIAIVAIAVVCGLINLGLRLFYPRKVAAAKTSSKSMALLFSGLHIVGEISLYLAVNMLLTVLLVFAFVARILAVMPIPLLGAERGSVLGFGSWLLAKFRLLAHDIIILGSLRNSGETIEYEADSSSKDVEKLSFVLGRCVASVHDTQKLLGPYKGDKAGCRAYILPHFAARGLEGDCTADILANKYVEELHKYVTQNPNVTEIKLIGADVGGAIFALTLEKVLVDPRFNNIKDFKFCIDESFTSLGKVTRSTGVFGFLYPVGPLLSLLGWNLSPAASIENILAKHSLDRDRNIKIYMGSSKSYGRLFGKGLLSEQSCFSRGRIQVYSQTKASDVMGFSAFGDLGEEFKEQDYFAKRFEKAKKYAGNHADYDYKESINDIGIADKKSFDEVLMLKAKLQYKLSSVQKTMQAGSKVASADMLAIGAILYEIDSLYKKDDKLEEAKDKFYYPVSKIISALGLIFLAHVSVILVPVSALVLSLMYLYSNTYKEGLYSRLNIALIFTSVSFFTLTCLGVLAFMGVLVAPYIIPLSIMMSGIFFGVILVRSNMRSYEARTGVEQGLIMNMTFCFELADSIDKLSSEIANLSKPSEENLAKIVELEKEILLLRETLQTKKTDLAKLEEKQKLLQESADKEYKDICALNTNLVGDDADLPEERIQPAIVKLGNEIAVLRQSIEGITGDVSYKVEEIKRLSMPDAEIAENISSKIAEKKEKQSLLMSVMQSFKVLSEEQASLLSGVKSPGEKYFRQMPNMRRRLKAYKQYQSSIEGEGCGKGLEVLKVLDDATNGAKYKTEKIFLRDMPWLAANGFIAIAVTAVFFNLLPVTLSLVVAIFVVVALATVANVSIKACQKNTQDALKLGLDSNMLENQGLVLKGTQRRASELRSSFYKGSNGQKIEVDNDSGDLTLNSTSMREKPVVMGRS